jgi:hypothetical protein
LFSFIFESLFNYLCKVYILEVSIGIFSFILYECLALFVITKNLCILTTHSRCDLIESIHKWTIYFGNRLTIKYHVYGLAQIGLKFPPKFLCWKTYTRQKGGQLGCIWISAQGLLSKVFYKGFAKFTVLKCLWIPESLIDQALSLVVDNLA